MFVCRIEGATRVLGEAQGYRALPVRDEVLKYDCGSVYQVMRTAWEPTPEELARLNAGAKIELIIVGTGHPPVHLSVGDVPE
jgi:hypothetical protein